MTQTPQSVIEKVLGLLRLAEGSESPNERAVAASRAAEIMQRHRLEQCDLRVTTDEEQVSLNGASLPLDFWANRPAWFGILSWGVCETQNCRCAYSRDAHGPCLRIIERPSDAQVASYLCAYLRREIDARCHEALKRREISGRTAANNFRNGAVRMVLGRLRAANLKANTTATSTAIVRVEAQLAEADRAFRQDGGRGRVHRSRIGDYDAFEAGRAAGAKIPLNKGIDGKREPGA